MTSLLSLERITKAYPGVLANDAVDFAVERGEIHALLGENGAGKSTLMKVLSGLTKPDSGRIVWKGQETTIASPQASKALGIGMVHQHFALFDGMSVGENIALGLGGQFDATQRDRIIEMSEKYGLPLDPDALVFTLSAGEKQRIEIVRALLGEPELLILDEPTSVLTPQEAEALFATLRLLRDEGRGLVFISHKLNEVRALCERATILRGGKVVGSCDPRETSARDMAEMMVGKVLQVPERAKQAVGDTILSLTGLSAPSPHAFGTALKDINCEIRSGEILGIGGVAGNGQDELVAVLSGETVSPKGMIVYRGEDIGTRNVNARRKLGLLAAPEERIGHAAAPDMSLTENAVMTGNERKSLNKSGFVRWAAAKSFAEDIISAFDVRTPGPENAARSLSGGNLQKFVIGREILQDPDIFVVNQPTWGVDASAAADIRQALLDLAAKGAAVICISQDLDELMEISDRFCALNEGRLSDPVPAKGLTVDQIGLMLGGAKGMEVADV